MPCPVFRRSEVRGPAASIMLARTPIRTIPAIRSFRQAGSQRSSIRPSPTQPIQPDAGSTTFTDMFSYTQAGQVSGKRLRVTKVQPYPNGANQTQTGVGDLNLGYGYNNEGKVTGVTYPTDANNNTPAYTYSYDSMMRLSSLTANDGGTGVSNVAYNVANQLLSINYYGATETRSYNNLLQLISINGNTYNYPR